MTIPELQKLIKKTIKEWEIILENLDENEDTYYLQKGEISALNWVLDQIKK